MTIKEREKQLNRRIELATCIIGGIILTGGILWISHNLSTDSKVTEIPSTSEVAEDKAYIICDIVSYEYDNGIMYTEMPSGDIEIYYIPEDAPEEADEVCFFAKNQDDYTSYEVVALR